MKRFSICTLGLIMGLAGCMQQPETTRSAMTMQNELGASQGHTLASSQRLPKGVVAVQSLYEVRAVNVTVPRSLSVSEANSLLPRADIVWRGEPRGDRYQQVETIFNDAAAQATGAMRTGPGVVVDITVTSFHALSERARYTVGGNYNMRFLLTVRDAETGKILQGPRPIVGDIAASGGNRAVDEEAKGMTQKVVVHQRLVEVLRRELSGEVNVLPDGALVTRFDGSAVTLPGATAIN